LLTFKKEYKGGRARVTKSQKRVLWCGWRDLCALTLWSRSRVTKDFFAV